MKLKVMRQSLLTVTFGSPGSSSSQNNKTFVVFSLIVSVACFTNNNDSLTETICCKQETMADFKLEAKNKKRDYVKSSKG